MKAEAVETETGIYGLFGKYRPLSNFHLEDFIFEGRKYRCSEAAYMSCKTIDIDEKMNLTVMDGPTAKKYGQTIQLVKNWNVIRVSMMTNVLREKFKQSKSLMDLLVQTDKKYIEETNWWNDRFWGVCEGTGENNLGKILMSIRDNRDWT